MSDKKGNTEYEKKCLCILDSLDRISNKTKIGLNYDPRAILRSSNINYDKNKYVEKEMKSFDFSNKFFNFPKDLNDEISEDELELNEKAIKKYIETKKENEDIKQTHNKENINNYIENIERPVFNEKVKENIIRNSEKKLFMREKIDLDQYNKFEYDFNNDNNNDDVEMESDKYVLFKKYKNENLFFNEIYSKDNIMDMCDMIGKEIEKGNNPSSHVNENLKHRNQDMRSENKLDIEDMHIENNELKIKTNNEDNLMQIDSATTAKFKKAPRREQNKKTLE